MLTDPVKTCTELMRPRHKRAREKKRSLNLCMRIIERHRRVINVKAVALLRERNASVRRPSERRRPMQCPGNVKLVGDCGAGMKVAAESK